MTADFALVATGDFNGDGIPDFVAPNYFEFGGSPTIFLGKGDGTFTFSKVTFTLDYFPTSVLVADFNGDGVLDLAFSDLNGVEIALGNGDGTFAPGTHYVDASYAGDRNYGAVTSSTIPLIGGLPPVRVSPNSLSFGNEAVGTTSPAKTVTLDNTSTDTLDISSITPSGDFAISANTCGATLAGKKSCKVSITFTPMALGTLTGTLTFTDNAANSPQTVPLSGTGVESATLTPASAVYAKQKVGTTSAAKTFTLTNNQPVDLTGIAISTTGNFAVSATTCEASLNAKAKCKISVTFSPTETGTQTGQLIVQDSASNNPQTSNLTGTGK